jgi:hypothetical protein
MRNPKWESGVLMVRRRESTPCKTVLYLSALLIQAPLAAQTARQLAQNTFPSVVLLVMQDANGQPASLGSGFFVGEGLIATNVHVVRGASSGQARRVGLARAYAVNSVVAVDARADLAVLKIPGFVGPPLKLGQSEDVAVGDAVYAIGNPEGLEGTFSQGIVSGIRTIGGDKLLQITAPISPGSSGGPVINARGEVVGVAVAAFSEGQNLNFAIPSSYLASLLKRVGPPRALSAEKDLQTSRDSFARMSGADSTDAVTADDFAWDPTFHGIFSFTFRNHLRAAVKDIHFYVVLFEGDKERGYKPLDYMEGVTCGDVVIPPGLAKYIEETVNLNPKRYMGDCRPLSVSGAVSERTTKQEVRVLDFKLLE